MSGFSNGFSSGFGDPEPLLIVNGRVWRTPQVEAAYIVNGRIFVHKLPEESPAYNETLSESVTSSVVMDETIDFSESLVQFVTSSQAMAETYDASAAPTLSNPIYNTVTHNSAVVGCTVTF